ncbi:YdcF family protein [Acidobacteria bacterium AB60]|nr:YdcF family protein [Acidobacteria bacterium AB60]
MGTASEGTRQTTPRLRRIWAFLWFFGVLVAAAGGWCWWVYGQILHYATSDQAAPANAIVVFGAAEYDGRPSPVYRARLDHARNLYSRGIAPLIITLGGPGGDGYSEGEVGRQYLIGTGLSDDYLIAETQSTSTSESARRLAVIARRNHLQRLVVVSDSIHLFRIHEICAADGLNVLTSPRPRLTTEEKARDTDTISHEILTYTLWRLHLD